VLTRACKRREPVSPLHLAAQDPRAPSALTCRISQTPKGTSGRNVSTSFWRDSAGLTRVLELALVFSTLFFASANVRQTTAAFGRSPPAATRLPSWPPPLSLLRHQVRSDPDQKQELGGHDSPLAVVPELELGGCRWRAGGRERRVQAVGVGGEGGGVACKSAMRGSAQKHWVHKSTDKQIN